MSLLSFFKRAQEPEKDAVSQVSASFEQHHMDILNTIHTKPPGRYTWKITHTRIDGPRYGVNYFYGKGEVTVEAREALRCSSGYETLHTLCKLENKHIEFGSHDNAGGENAVVTYIALDTSRPYSDPELPVGPNAGPSTILHGECLDDDPRIVYDDEGFPYLDDMMDTVDTVDVAADVQENSSIQPAAAKKAHQLTVPKISFGLTGV